MMDNEYDNNKDTEIEEERKKFQLWTEEFRPKCINDYIGNTDNLNSIKNWIEDYKEKVEDTDNFLLLHGKPGIGKTTIAHIILNEYGFDVIEFNASDHRSKKKIQNILNSIGKYSILDFDKPRKVGLIMDEVDGIDKNGIIELITIIHGVKKKLKNNFKFPVICTCNNIKDKKMLSLLRKSCVIGITKPEKTDLITLLNKIIKEKNIIINKKQKDIIIKYSKNDYRALIYNIQQFTLLNSLTFLESEKSYKIELQNMNVQDNISKLKFLLTNNNIPNSDLYIESSENEFFYYLNIHDNYVSLLENKKQCKNTDNILIDISNNYNYCEELKNFIYKNSCWEANCYIIYIGIVSNINLLKKHRLKNKNKSIMLNYHTNFNVLLQNKSLLNKKQKYINDIHKLNDIESIYYFGKSGTNWGNKDDFKKINDTILKITS